MQNREKNPKFTPTQKIPHLQFTDTDHKILQQFLPQTELFDLSVQRGFYVRGLALLQFQVHGRRTTQRLKVQGGLKYNMVNTSQIY